MYPNGLKALLTATAFAAGAADAMTTELDLSPMVHASTGSGPPVGPAAGKTGTAATALNVDLLDPGTGNPLRIGASTGQTADDLATGIDDAAAADTLINPRYGQAGTPALGAVFAASAGADQTFILLGHAEVRDADNGGWTDTLEGTTTRQWWTNDLSPSPDEPSHRLEARRFSLSAAVATQPLTDIVSNAGDAAVEPSESTLTAADLLTGADRVVPKPASAALMLLGVASLIALARRRRASVSPPHRSPDPRSSRS